MKPHKDLTNRTFGKLNVEEYLRREPDGKHIWLCRCECGKEREVWGRWLTRGVVTSCGSKECKKSGYRKGNKYEFYDDVAIGYDSNGNAFYIDVEDCERVSKYTWLMTAGGYFSAYSLDENGKRKDLLLHRFIMDVDDSSVVIDHKNHCRHDCRKANLVKTDAVGNMQNIIKPNCNNDPYIKAIKKFVIRKHPEFGEFNTAKEASNFYQDYLLKQIEIQKED